MLVIHSLATCISMQYLINQTDNNTDIHVLFNSSDKPNECGKICF